MAETFILKHIQDEDNLIFEYPSAQFKQKLNELLSKCEKKTNDYVSITINRPYKKRTTGENSQNNLFWKLVSLIAEDTGNELSDVEDAVKERALRRGYPYKCNPMTNKIKPVSTTTVNTVEMSYLIDECYQLCSELGIELDESFKTEKSESLVIQAMES